MAKQVIMPETLAEAADKARMSPCIVSRGHAFLTGMTGADSDGVMPQEAERQFRNSFDKIALVLREAGADLDAVVEMTSYHIGLRDHFALFDAVRLSVFNPPYPAWTAIEAGGLRREGALVEIRVIAALP